ncbi:lipid-binding SYLF domain-containing protein [Arenibacter sp. GZD96]|uniref:lipid-binding SYLF domain-containing protein n=1 Tax=Aurantibrevibacter litoralis TaxID=3106030 RepID=UPI002AFF3461|nr:lipid-binding SYLF domain-containing protein [Arenibacter sp. GZD-96]MEA1785832.1 lipid-binding SYLF domain-containing protein [Arenibacter sp. GZD-96]
MRTVTIAKLPLKTILLLTVLCSSLSFGQSERKKKEIIEEAKEAKAEFLKQDPGLEKFFNESYGYVIFPNVGKGGLLVGAAAGTGAVWQQGELIGTAKLKQLNIGLQAGGQAYREVIFFEKDADLSRLKGNKAEFSAQVSAVALKSGVSADAKYVDGVVVFTMAKSGLMYEASVGGQKFTYNSL